MRTISRLLAALVALVLCWPLLPLQPEVSAEAWLLFGQDLFLLAVPVFGVYLGMKAHLRQDHADGVWATEAAALSWVLASPLLTPLAGSSRFLATGAAFLYGAHLLAITGHRRPRPSTLAGAGAALAGALIAEAQLWPLVVVVALHALFGGYRHLSRPRFNALSGRVVAVLAGFLPLTIVAGLLRDGPLLSPLPLLEPEAGRLLAALLAPGGLLLGVPWLLLALGGLGLWWKRGTRRGFLWVTLGVLLVSLASTWPLLLLALLPFLAGPTARLLSHWRDRPGRRGPRMAGLGFGLIVAGALGASGLPAILENPGTALAWTRAPPLAAVAVAMALLGLLLPGRASGRGRLEAALLSGLLGVLLAGGLHLLATL